MGMFGNNKEGGVKDVNVGELNNTRTIIAKGTAISGNIETYGNVRVEGNIAGDIKSKAKVVLGDTAEMKGKILAQNAEIAGQIEGSVEIAEVLTLKPSAIINGDIQCNKLIIEAGAKFNGKCQMGHTVKSIEVNSTPQIKAKVNETSKIKESL